MTTRRSLATLAVVLLVLVLGVAVLYAVRAQPPTTAVATPTPTATATATAAAQSATPSATIPPSPTTTATAAPQAGAITGALQFPSNFIPPLTVYAISTADQRVWFSVETPRYPLATNTPPQPSYTINGVAPGSYYVVAYRVDGQFPDPGIYSRYVVNCKPGAPSAACADHSLVPVNVTAAQTTTGIDVTDWSHGSVQPTPSIPPRPTPR